MEQDREERVRTRAYEIWEREGRGKAATRRTGSRRSMSFGKKNSARGSRAATPPRRQPPGPLVWRAAFSQAGQLLPPDPEPVLGPLVPAAEAPQMLRQERRERNPDTKESARAGWWRLGLRRPSWRGMQLCVTA